MIPILVASGDRQVKAELQNSFSKIRLTNPVKWVQTDRDLREVLWGRARFRPSLLFMTTELPGGDPREVLLLLRGDKALSDVTVVLISPTPLSRAQLLKLNADLCLTKPVTMEAVGNALSSTERFSLVLVRQ